MNAETCHPAPPRRRASQGEVARDTRVVEELSAIAQCLCGYRYPVGNEDVLEAAVSVALSSGGFAHRRQQQLSKAERPDCWLLRSNIAVELKVDGTLASALRQCGRYAGLDQVEAVILAFTAPWRFTDALLSLRGKPVLLVPLPPRFVL